MFDDEAGPPIHGVSRALVLRLNMAAKRASVQHEYSRPEPTVAVAEGGAQQLPGGNVMVGFGATPFFSEFSKAGGPHKEGTLLFDASLPKGDGTYRVFRFPWNATPKTSPAIAAVRESPASRRLRELERRDRLSRAGKSSRAKAPSLAPAGRTRRAALRPRSRPDHRRNVRGRALNGEGKVLATSAVVSAP